MEDPKRQEQMLDKELQFWRTRVSQSRDQLAVYRDLNKNLMASMHHSEEVFREYFSLPKGPMDGGGRPTNKTGRGSSESGGGDAVSLASPLHVLQARLEKLQAQIGIVQKELGGLLVQDDEILKNVEKAEYKVSKRRDKLEKELKGWEKARREGWNKLGKLQDQVLENGGSLCAGQSSGVP